MSDIDDARWELLNAHRAAIVAACHRRGSSLEDAEDIAAEALLRAATFQALDESRAPQWLHKVARHLTIDAFRRRVTPDLAARLVHQDCAATPQDAVDDRLEAAWLATHLTHLPDAQAAALRLRSCGMTNAEIATSLEVSAKAVESLLSRARETMRAIFESAGAVAVGVFAALRAPRSSKPAIALSSFAIPLLVLLPRIDQNQPSLSTPTPVVGSAPEAAPRVLHQPITGGGGPEPRVEDTSRAQPRPSSPSAAERVLVLPPTYIGPVGHDGVGTSRDHSEESLVESTLRCIQEGPAVSLERIGCF